MLNALSEHCFKFPVWLNFARFVKLDRLSARCVEFDLMEN